MGEHLNLHKSMDTMVRRFSGKLLLRQEIPLDDNHFKWLLASSYFTPVPAIQRKLFFYQCRRCGNAKRSLIGMMPCAVCHKTHPYCRKCIEMGRVTTCEPLYQWTGPDASWPAYDDALTWHGELTDAQKKAAERVVKAIESTERKLLIWAVCGAGKTEMLFPGIHQAIRTKKRVCIATPRADVVRELLPRLQEAFSTVPIEALYGGSKDKEATAQIILSTTHQLLRFQDAFDVLIIDEIDAFPYHADPSLPYAANRARKPSGTIVYLTATPRKRQRLLIALNLLPHMFVPIRFHGHPLPVPRLQMCFALQKGELPQAFLTWCKTRKNPQRQLLIFVPTVELAECLAKKLALFFKQENIIDDRADLQSVHASDHAREEKVHRFRRKEIFILLTTTILERGVTFPSVDVAVLDAGHDVFDEAALVQIAGRAGRSPDDPDGEVVFFHDGKTESIVDAVRSIKTMNKRAGFSSL
ncbi:MAG TPA: DEAD/DEAH box helicase family protein [Bacillota bacterium]|nr:DEAD/DEAH box helicase family protein [Bacillota bacterium]